MAAKILELPPDIDCTIKNIFTCSDYTFETNSDHSRKFAKYLMELFFEGNELLFEQQIIYIESIQFLVETSEFVFRILWVEKEQKERNLQRKLNIQSWQI